MNALATMPARMTADVFMEQYSNERVELVAGFVQELPMPKFRHGWLCALLTQLFKNHVDERDFGHVVSHDTFIRVKREPDTVRGPDISFYSYQRVPKHNIPDDIIDIMPEIVIEVKSPTDRWTQLHTKVAEYLEAGIGLVIVVDDDAKNVTLFRDAVGPQVLTASETLTLPELPGFELSLAKLFLG